MLISGYQGIKKVHEYIGIKYTALQVGLLYADGKPITTVAFDEINISSQGKPMVCHKGALTFNYIKKVEVKLNERN